MRCTSREVLLCKDNITMYHVARLSFANHKVSYGVGNALEGLIKGIYFMIVLFLVGLGNCSTPFKMGGYMRK